MGTERFREDVSEALKTFLRDKPGQQPNTLIVNFRDAMAWHTAQRSRSSFNDFLNQHVKAYMDTLPFHKSPLVCSVILLNVDDDSPTHFE